MTRGKFVTLEGGEGAGKSLNLQYVRDMLGARGIPVRVTREPGGTSLGEELRELLLKPGRTIVAEAELLLLFAARAQHVQELIRPTLEAGVWVLCDRYADASYAYQAGGRGLATDFVRCLEQRAQSGITPDLTLLLDVPVEIGMARAAKRGSADRIEAESLAFFERVRAAYLDLAATFPQRIRVVDAAQPLERVQARIADILDEFCRS